MTTKQEKGCQKCVWCSGTAGCFTKDCPCHPQAQEGGEWENEWRPLASEIFAGNRLVKDTLIIRVKVKSFISHLLATERKRLYDVAQIDIKQAYVQDTMDTLSKEGAAYDAGLLRGQQLAYAKVQEIIGSMIPPRIGSPSDADREGALFYVRAAVSKEQEKI